MKGVILAGGRGTRLYPLTRATNKHLLPVGQEPMIYHSIRQLVLAGIDDILIITSTYHIGDMVNCLGSGSCFNCSLTYKVQEEPNGIAHALCFAKDFVNNKKCCVILGDNIFEYAITPYVEHFKKQKEGARVLLKKVSNPEQFGVAELNKKRVVKIQEKPEHPNSAYAVLGLYFYDNKLFDIIATMSPSKRGEYEITTLNNIYINMHQLEYDDCVGGWADAGTIDSLLKANIMLINNHNRILLHE